MKYWISTFVIILLFETGKCEDHARGRNSLTSRKERGVPINGNIMEFQNFVVDSTRKTIYGLSLENQVWQFLTNDTFYSESEWLANNVTSINVDKVTGSLVIMQIAPASNFDFKKHDDFEEMCQLLLKPLQNNSANVFITISSKYLPCSHHLEIDEVVGKMFFSTNECIQSTNFKGENSKCVVKADHHVFFTLDKKERRIVVKRDENPIECFDYEGRRKTCSKESLKAKAHVKSLQIHKGELYISERGRADTTRENILTRSSYQLNRFHFNNSTKKPLNVTKVEIVDFSHSLPLTPCSIDNGNCELACVMSDERKQCLCASGRYHPEGNCSSISRSLIYSEDSIIHTFNAEKNLFESENQTVSSSTECYQNISSLLVDYKHRVIYFTDLKKEGVFSMNMENGKCENAVTATGGSVNGLALDVDGRDLYYIHSNRHQIYKVSLTAHILRRAKKLVFDSKNEMDVFTHLHFEPCTQTLYYSNNNNEDGSSIQSVSSNGHKNHTIIGNLEFVYGMDVDNEAHKIYFTHDSGRQISRCDYDGTHLEDLMPFGNAGGLYDYITIVDKDLVFLHNKSEFMTAHKVNMDNIRTVIKKNSKIDFFASFDKNSKMCLPNLCVNNYLRCSDHCRLSGSGEPVCGCFGSKILEEDQRTCRFPKCSEWCLNHSHCSHMNMTHIECKCRSGTYGNRCQYTYFDQKFECLNGGEYASRPSEHCKCSKGFGGARCEVKTARSCDNLECLHLGECDPGTVQCTCDNLQYFNGENCTAHTCEHYCYGESKCTEIPNQLPFCECEVGKYGERCEHNSKWSFDATANFFVILYIVSAMSTGILIHYLYRYVFDFDDTVFSTRRQRSRQIPQQSTFHRSRTDYSTGPINPNEGVKPLIGSTIASLCQPLLVRSIANICQPSTTNENVVEFEMKDMNAETPMLMSSNIAKAPILASSSVAETPILASSSVAETPILASSKVAETPILASSSVAETPILANSSVAETPILASSKVAETPILTSTKIAAIVEEEEEEEHQQKEEKEEVSCQQSTSNQDCDSSIEMEEQDSYL